MGTQLTGCCMAPQKKQVNCNNMKTERKLRRNQKVEKDQTQVQTEAPSSTATQIYQTEESQDQQSKLNCDLVFAPPQTPKLRDSLNSKNDQQQKVVVIDDASSRMDSLTFAHDNQMSALGGQLGLSIGIQSSVTTAMNKIIIDDFASSMINTEQNFGLGITKGNTDYNQSVIAQVIDDFESSASQSRHGGQALTSAAPSVTGRNHVIDDLSSMQSGGKQMDDFNSSNASEYINIQASKSVRNIIIDDNSSISSERSLQSQDSMSQYPSEAPDITINDEISSVQNKQEIIIPAGRKKVKQMTLNPQMGQIVEDNDDHI